VEELTRALVESGALVREPAGYRLRAAPAALNMPATVQGVLLARIDRLPAALKTVLQAASVIGRVFSYPVLARVVAPGTALDQVLLQLEEAKFLYPYSLTPQGEFSFKHVLTQEAVYQTLLRPQRKEYHARIAQAIETLSAERLEEVYEVLAHHYVRSGQRDKAVEYLALANQKAAKVNAMTPRPDSTLRPPWRCWIRCQTRRDISGGALSCWCPSWHRCSCSCSFRSIMTCCCPTRRWRSGWAMPDSWERCMRAWDFVSGGWAVLSRPLKP
jgi:hypothetical protein